ncbi:MAG TPA: hypothetical protein VD886_20400, partial [Herpetosiphonaceae bacterium]|nr:hypothetical protein [Herpetosiphonaceae bacterium]
MRFHKILSSLLFVCLLAQLFLHPGGAAAAPPRQIASAEATVLPADSFRTGRRASLADAQAYRYMEGHGYTYEQEMAVTTTSFTQDAAGVTPVADRFETTSTVRLVPVRQLASGAHLLQVTISDPHMWTVEAGQRVDGMTRELAAELAKPFYAVQNATGRIETVFVATDERTGSANLKRGIFSGFQVEVDDAPAGAAVEADPNGDVTSSYARVAVDDQVVITRERDEADYIRLVDPAIPMDAVDIAETQTAIFNPGLGALSVISSTEHFATADPARFPYAGKGVGTWTTIDGQSLLRLSTVSSAPVSEPLPSVARDATPAAMLAAINRATGRPYQASTLRAPYEAPVENIDPTVDLRTALAELAADQTGSFGFIHQLGQALKSSPARLDELVSLLRAGAVDRALYPQLAVALAAVGTPQAQAIMIGQLLQDPAAPEATRNAVLMTLPDLKTPDAATMRAVQDLSESRDPLAEQARLVLGGLLEVQAASDPAAAAAG